MAKMSITFKGFEQLAEDIDAIGGDLHKAVDEALNESQKIIQNNLQTAAADYSRKGGGKGYTTGKMYQSIITSPQVEWNGLIGEVKVGFNLSSKGGWHSIFIMYGTPRMAKNQKVYNAIRGTKTKNQIAKKQEEIMQDHLKLGGK
jgi:hypothetical protein